MSPYPSTRLGRMAIKKSGKKKEQFKIIL